MPAACQTVEGQRQRTWLPAACSLGSHIQRVLVNNTGPSLAERAVLLTVCKSSR